jgi:NAD(P)-dependent dehydrogenase (short-subunit alcohol dehydrogenase family)
MSDRKRTVVITGAAQGIGRRTAEVFAERGYRVALVDLRRPDETLASVESRGVEALGHAADLTEQAAVERFARQVHERFAVVDALVNNAGISLIAHGGDFHGRVSARAGGQPGGALCPGQGLRREDAGAAAKHSLGAVNGAERFFQRRNDAVVK